MPSQEDQHAPASGGGKKWLVLGATVLALAGGGVVYMRKAKAPEAEEEKVARPVVVDPGILELAPFVLNLSDETGDRFFRLNLRLVLDQREIAKRTEGGRAMAMLRDKILSILSKKRATQFNQVEGKELLRTELFDAIEALLSEEPFHDPDVDPAPARVLEVLFTEFLVQ